MKLEFDKRWRIDASPAAGWKLLGDLRRLPGCMPGARVAARPDERHADGTFVLKVGSASLSFNGRLEVVALDDARHELRLRGEGAEVSGSSKGSFELRSCIEPEEDPEGCTLVGHAEVTVEGKAAAFGAPALQTAADFLLKQFAKRFSEEARLLQGRMPKPAPAVAPVAASQPTAAVESPALVPAPAPVVEALAAAPEPTQGTEPPATLWSRWAAWLRGLLGGR